MLLKKQRVDAKDEQKKISKLVVENEVNKSDTPGYDALVKSGDILNLSTLLVE